ncbi:CPBP family intramembrane glutamic endopeptidase [Bacillus sp. FJAT-42315]|uniref:CPBP family intramembrane glutamic endopeptidase n=1 Tax=Bacillus sp. FJAT-42315 TaxID=2014077 RepID=UPI000C242000|nr:CPBP family intramembrane glutamic endopeptidase [Bacillus sp. FJAT-42315]
MTLNITNRKRNFILVSPIVIILLGFITATIWSKVIDEWAWVPLAIVYWSLLGICIKYFKGNKQIKDWLKKPKSSRFIVFFTLILGLFPISVIMMNYEIFNSIWLVVLWLLFAIINPFFEELYWRGLLLDAAMKLFPKWIAVAYSTIFFVLSHPLMWGVFSIANAHYHVFIYLTILGVVWSYTYFQTQSLRWVMLSHFFVDIGIMTVPVFLNLYVPPNA